jgi:uncharacterized protein YndB with AHSA1/START domain
MKKVLLVIAAIIAVILVVALIAPKEYAVEREVLIDCPKEQVFEYVKSLELQNEWSVWGELDPNAVYTYTGVDGTQGFISAWEGNKDVGKGEQEIVNIVEGERVEFELRFIEPFKSTANVYITTHGQSEYETLVKWGMSGKMPFPTNLFLLLMNMDKSIGKDFEQGLANLKIILEGV